MATDTPQEVRHAVAETFLTYQNEELRKLPRGADHCSLELGLYDTELAVRVGNQRCQTVHMLTWQLRLFRSQGHHAET